MTAATNDQRHPTTRLNKPRKFSISKRQRPGDLARELVARANKRSRLVPVQMSLPGERLLQVRILIDPTLRSQAELGYEEREVLRFLAALHAEARLAQEARGASLRLVMFVEPRHELGQDALLSRVEAVARDSSVIACVQRARSNSIEGEVNAFRKTLEVLERVEREHPRDRVMVVRVSRNLQLALSGVVAQGLRRRGFSALTLLAPFA